MLKQYKVNNRAIGDVCEPVCRAVQHDGFLNVIPNLFRNLLKQIQHDEFLYVIPNLFRNLLKQILHDIFQLFNISTFKRALAFTLAETLIVMGIIGVVAALTLPNLNSSTGNKEKVARLQKIYSNLEDAVGRAQTVYGPVDEWCSGLSDNDCIKRKFERITEFMKYSKICQISDSCTQFAGNTTSGGGVLHAYKTPYAVILPDGATVGFVEYNSVHVDIDGIGKGADKECTDTFFFSYDKFGMHYTSDKSLDNDTPSVYKCGAWVLMYNNMDYLKCSGLKFNTDKTTCK